MYIFNLNSRPHLILTQKELLFRNDLADQDMQRHLFDEIEKISMEHRHDADKKVLFFLRLKISTQKAPIYLQLCTLDTPLEEVLSVLSQELETKVRMSLPSAKWIQRKKSTNNPKKIVPLAIALLCAGLVFVHTYIVPSLESLDSTVLRANYEETLGLCSANAKAALPSSQENMIEVTYYCGILGLWKESSSKTIPRQYLDAEFASLGANDYLLRAKESMDINKSTKAVNQIANALYLNPKSAKAYLLLSKVQNSLGFTKKALTSLLKASSLNPESSSIAAALASLYLQEKEFNEAYIYARKATLLKASAANLTLTAKIETALDMTEQAIKHYELALEKDPDNLSALSELSHYYRRQHDFSKAAQKLKKIYTLDPDNALNFLNYYEIAIITPLLLEQKDTEEFIKRNKDDKKAMMIYDMLHAVRLSIENVQTQEALALWTKNYADERLEWSFETLRGWLDGSQLDIEHIQHIQNTIGFFIGYQHAYKMNHNEGNL